MTITKRRLDDYLEDVPATFAVSRANETIPDSSSDTSDIDEPKPINQSAAAGPSRLARPTSPRTPLAQAGSRGTYIARPFSVQQPSASAKRGVVEAVRGPGGKLKYETTVDPQEGHFFAVQWRKPQTKKHKTWDGDAFIRILGNRCHLLSEDGGDPMGVSSIGGGLPVEGTPLRIGNYEAEVDRAVTFEEFNKATCILNRKTAVKTQPTAYAPAILPRAFKAPSMVKPARQTGGYIPAQTTDENSAASSISAGPSRGTSISMGGPGPVQPVKTIQAISQRSFYAAPEPKKAAAKVVIGEKSAKEREAWGGAVFNPHEEGAVVMPRPPEKLARDKGTEINDVVLDPLLAAKMRSHQKEGVKFLYACAMGLTGAEGNGCILADEMGLGKTLQTIALIHMLLRQSPFKRDGAVISKALIVCPVGLCDNWRKEFKKWTRNNEISVVIGDTDQQIQTFAHYKAQHVLIIGYEKLRKCSAKLAKAQPPIDLIVCDEGHRLKSKDNKTTQMFEVLKTRRRIILSGTPVQNDLGEYWAMANFCCPGILGDYKQFQKHYEKPITRSREVGASRDTVENGKMKAEELSALSKQFVLRRTADVLNNYLPPKHEYVLFVAPSQLQLDVYSSILSPSLAKTYVKGAGVQGLAMIDLLRKVSNTPVLVQKKDDDGQKSGDIGEATEAALQVIPREIHTRDVTVSGKLSLLDKLLHEIYNTTQEKIVVVSNWTATLNVIQEVCKARHYSFMRLDGSTTAKDRQPLVDAFNRESRTQSFIFLLSAKAGGVGLNLIGASRLILFDSDWNPSTDLQAMARIHRDGQKKPVFIYRLLTTNTIDEKIYQRQITKTGLSDQMLDQKQGKDSKDSFSPAELRDIFTLRLTTDGCQTHDLLQCDCQTRKSAVLGELDSNLPGSAKGSSSDSEDEGVKGFVNASQYDPAPTAKMLKKQAEEQQQKLAALKNWTHFDGFSIKSFKSIADTILYNTIWKEHDSLDDTVSSPSSASGSLGGVEEEGGEGGIEDVSDSEWQKARKVPVPTKKKPAQPVRSLRDMLDGEAEDDDRVMDSAAEDEDEEDYGANDSDDSGSLVSSKPHDQAAKNRAKPANSRTSGVSQDSKRYSLAKIASGGGVGRIMFAFEKVSQSKLLASREGSIDEGK